MLSSLCASAQRGQLHREQTVSRTKSPLIFAPEVGDGGYVKSAVNNTSAVKKQVFHSAVLHISFL